MLLQARIVFMSKEITKDHPVWSDGISPIVNVHKIEDQALYFKKEYYWRQISPKQTKAERAAEKELYKKRKRFNRNVARIAKLGGSIKEMTDEVRELKE